ncbi:hypothetical protein CLV62_104124 [Dysgonomonas alginatilytica]|uniref:Minor structural protein GP20 n=2 Tax=Dysgonomonas alginatilytica TaxID=1605892 RepID=A0A2V3PTB6_9BACT|nr:hypothetical protein CLV62_104124 [Dysgonomonas alginatilytica]
MEKEKLSADLKGLVGETSLSDRTWNDYLEQSVIPHLPSEEDKIGDYLGKHAIALKSINGQLNNEVATRVNDFKKNYKPVAVNSEQSTVDNPDKSVQHADNEKLTDLETRLQRFEKVEAEKKAAKAKTEKLTEVKKLMQKEGSTNETVIGLILPQLKIREDLTAEDLAKAGKTLYDKAYTDLYGETYVPAFGGNSTLGSQKGDKDAYMKHLKETGRIK